ncbi:MAG: sarcosine oxidase subunit delta [Rhodospirillales bacterium]|nr:sarcosine oxidase subunit delta [Rhodospirillales bacterium]
MLLIECPYCGRRPEIEFHHGGEAHIARPEDPDALSDEAWANYLYMRANTKGWRHERWMHAAGCRRWFNAIRHTVSNEILVTYEMGTETPPLPTVGD